MQRRASVSIITAVSMMALLGMADLATEYGYLLVLQVRAQRVADLAAYAGALDYSASATTTAMQNAASGIATLNGGSTATASLTTSPRNNGNSAVKAVVTFPYKALFNGKTFTPMATSYVELADAAPPCVIALNGAGAGIALSGGTRLSTSGCAAASNASESVPCGTYLYSDVVDWDSTAPTNGCQGIQPVTKSSASIRQVLTADPLAGSPAVTDATARLASVASLSAPAAPAASGGANLNFDYRQNASIPTGNACTATHAAYTGSWTVTCPSGGTYAFGSISVSGGITANFDTGSTSSTYTVSGPVTVSGGTLGFGSGTFNLAGGLMTSSGSVTSFGSGTFSIGRLSAACSDGGLYSICNTASLSFGGPATMVLQAGLYNGGGSTLSVGASSTLNSYRFGNGSTGLAMSVGGGSTTTLGDATSGLFQLVGGISAGGGACIVLPATGQHDIYGSIKTAGGLVMGAGVYTITGYFDIGGSGGGDWTCNQQQVGVSAANTTLVIGAAQTPSDSCSGQALCVAAGFGHVVVTAPSTGTDANLAVIGPTNGITAGASFTEGATSTIMSGAFYFPQGPLSLGGAASVSSGGNCLELIASQVALSGGSAAATICPNLGGATSTSPVLVQ